MHTLYYLAPIILAEPTATGAPDMTEFVSKLTTAITPAQLLQALGSVVGIGMGFVLMWFGVRKAVSVFSSAVRSGKLRI